MESADVPVTPVAVWAIVLSVVVATGVGAAVDVWLMRRRAGQQKTDTGAPRFWVVGMLVSSYAVLIPGLFAHLFESKTDMFGMETVSEYDETMVSLVRRLVSDDMLVGAILVTMYAMVVPLLKLIMLAAGEYLRRGGPERVRWARRCILVVQGVSKWASPDMFAYILLMYLIRGLNKPPSINSFMNLDLGFTCFCVFCVGSTVSSLGVRVPTLPEPADGAAAPQPRRIPPAAAATLQVVLTLAFAVLLVRGLVCSSMSLHLDMGLLYQQKPELLPLKDLIDSMDLPSLLHLEVGVWECIVQLFQWVGNGEMNSLIALILYAVFAVCLPVVDMTLLLAATLLNSFGGSSSARSRSVLAASHVVRKMAMLDVSVMGCFVVSMSLASMRAKGVIVELHIGVLYLLCAEIGHYSAAFVACRAAQTRSVDEARAVSEKKAASNGHMDAAEKGNQSVGDVSVNAAQV